MCVCVCVCVCMCFTVDSHTPSTMCMFVVRVHRLMCVRYPCLYLVFFNVHVHMYSAFGHMLAALSVDDGDREGRGNYEERREGGTV